MRIKKEDVADFIKETILSIRTGMQALQAEGFVFDGFPKEIPFSLEIVHAEQDVIQVTETVGENNEAAVTDVETVARDTAQTTNEGGGDTDVSDYEYESFED